MTCFYCKDAHRQTAHGDLSSVPSTTFPPTQPKTTRTAPLPRELTWQHALTQQFDRYWRAD